MLCESCPYLSQCTERRENLKMVTRHLEALCLEKRNNRKSIRNGKGESWVPIYTNVWESPNRNES